MPFHSTGAPLAQRSETPGLPWIQLPSTSPWPMPPDKTSSAPSPSLPPGAQWSSFSFSASILSRIRLSDTGFGVKDNALCEGVALGGASELAAGGVAVGPVGRSFLCQGPLVDTGYGSNAFVPTIWVFVVALPPVAFSLGNVLLSLPGLRPVGMLSGRARADPGCGGGCWRFRLPSRYSDSRCFSSFIVTSCLESKVDAAAEAACIRPQTHFSSRPTVNLCNSQHLLDEGAHLSLKASPRAIKPAQACPPAGTGMSQLGFSLGARSRGRRGRPPHRPESPPPRLLGGKMLLGFPHHNYGTSGRALAAEDINILLPTERLLCNTSRISRRHF